MSFSSQHPLASPNAIPPRTSSTGVFPLNGTSVSSHKSHVLQPVSEVEWLGQSKRSKTSHSSDDLRRNLHQRSKSHNSVGLASSRVQEAAMRESSPAQATLHGNGAHGESIDEAVVYGNGLAWTEQKEKILLGPYDYLYGHPGKDIRSQCIAAFNLWLKIPPKRLDVITRVVGMLHTASLLVDDVEDSSLLRRGVPVANAIFGIPQTINSANYVYFKALQDLLLMRNPKLIDIFTEELLNLHRGQGMDLYWRDTLTCPSEADYLEMVGNKTGGLFRLAIKLMQAESDVDIDCTPLVSTIGLLFQILDDHLNLSPTSELTTLKGLAEDLTEGKFSFPVLHAIRADPSNQVLINILKQKTKDDEVKRYACRYMETMGSFAYSQGVIEELRGRVERGIAEVDEDIGGTDGHEGAEALRKVVQRLVLT